MNLRFFIYAIFVIAGSNIAFAFEKAQDSITFPSDYIEEELPLTSKDGIMARFIKYFDEANKPKQNSGFDFSVIGGPSYSSDKGLGIGLVAAGQYRTHEADSMLQPSVVSLYGNATTKKCFAVGVEGVNIFPHDKMRLNYDFSFSSYNTCFWGIGYEAGLNDHNKTDYKYFATEFRSDLSVKLVGNLYIGPVMSLAFIQGRRSDNPNMWDGLHKSTFNWGPGFALKYDTRDYITGPSKGVYAYLEQLFYPSFFGNKCAFSRTDIVACYYHPIWKDAILATRIAAHLTYGDTPWGLLPTFGGGHDMRGYFEGQYRDKCATSICIELRQSVWRRIGIAVWGGAGKIFPDFKNLKFNHILPNYGLGFRWEFKKRVNIRLDYGFGRHCSGFVFNINEAF